MTAFALAVPVPDPADVPPDADRCTASPSLTGAARCIHHARVTVAGARLCAYHGLTAARQAREAAIVTHLTPLLRVLAVDADLPAAARGPLDALMAAHNEHAEAIVAWRAVTGDAPVRPLPHPTAPA